MMSFTHQCLSLLLSLFYRDCFCQNFKQSLWLASACELSTASFLICPSLLGSFSFLDSFVNTDLSSLSSFVLIMLAHSAVREYNHSMLRLSHIILHLSQSTDSELIFILPSALALFWYYKSLQSFLPPYLFHLLHEIYYQLTDFHF